MSQADRAFVGAIPELYDRCLGPMLFEPFALDLAGRFEGFQGSLLEIAAGTGRLTRALAEAAPGAAITATDLNEPMLARAAELVRASNIGWRVADAQTLPFEDASFEAVVCQFGVMFFPDKAAAYAEARRMLRPDGRLVFSVWDRLETNDISAVAHDTLSQLFPSDPPTFLPRTPFGHHDEQVIRAGLRQAGFGEVRVETVALATPACAALAARGLCLGSPLRAEIEAHDPDGLDAAVEAVARALTERFGDDPITGKGQALVVTASG